MKGLPWRRHGPWWILGILLFTAAFLTAGVLWGDEKGARLAGSDPASGKAPLVQVKPPAKAPFDFQRLVGRWKRSDGDFGIVIQSVDADGRMEAVYTNPRLINIALAEAFREGETAKVFIVLWDLGYPGTTYELTYLPQKDALSGTCFLLPANKRLSVVFTRTR